MYGIGRFSSSLGRVNGMCALMFSDLDALTQKLRVEGVVGEREFF